MPRRSWFLLDFRHRERERERKILPESRAPLIHRVDERHERLSGDDHTTP